MRDCGLGVSDALLGARVAVVVWREGVHAAATDEGALAGGEAEVREQVGGGDGDGGVVGGCGGAVGEGAGDDAGVDALGGGEGGEGRFHGKGVGVEPV